ncbi:hypothetical protein V9T40_002600 [Parthenolecanium corni]|uniref:Peptidase M13 N-terminal domain-containing protein n=1 Tax=Parthenolecanium corni TaxID=536013 RepID=A0AAN9Y4M1_9HEMI
MLTRNMDVNVDPCENFYGFACGNFPNRFPRMAHEKHLSQVTLRNDEIGDKVLEFYSKADLRPYPNIRKLYALYSQCMEEVTYGLDTVSHHLGMVGLPEIPPFHKEPPDSYEVIQVLAKVHRYSPSTHFLFDVDTKTDPHNVTANHITFGPTPSSINAQFQKSSARYIRFGWPSTPEYFLPNRSTLWGLNNKAEKSQKYKMTDFQSVDTW